MCREGRELANICRGTWHSDQGYQHVNLRQILMDSSCVWPPPSLESELPCQGFWSGSEKGVVLAHCCPQMH